MAQCKCRKGYASKIDGKCANCRTKKEAAAIEADRRAYMIGKSMGGKFPNLSMIACPYTLDRCRKAWWNGVNQGKRESAEGNR